VPALRTLVLQQICAPWHVSALASRLASAVLALGRVLESLSVDEHVSMMLRGSLGREPTLFAAGFPALRDLAFGSAWSPGLLEFASPLPPALRRLRAESNEDTIPYDIEVVLEPGCAPHLLQWHELESCARSGKALHVIGEESFWGPRILAEMREKADFCWRHFTDFTMDLKPPGMVRCKRSSMSTHAGDPVDFSNAPGVLHEVHASLWCLERPAGMVIWTRESKLRHW
jgi:hypothetical protein